MPPELTTILLRAATAIAVLMVLMWLESIRRRDVSIIDAIWGTGFVVVAWTSFASLAASNRSLILPIAVTVWGVRLSGYLAWRNHGKPEDYRYAAMRKKWGDSFPLISLFTVFALQGLVMWVVSLPLQVGIGTPDRDITWLLVAGACFWVVGMCFESFGDWQLARFKAEPTNKGRVLDTGLWRYTRHPNYFGDFMVWWGFYLIAISQSSAWWTIVGPIVMSIFLMRVSGVTLLEKSLEQTKPGYAAYVSKTNAFFPGPPRHESPPGVSHN